MQASLCYRVWDESKEYGKKYSEFMADAERISRA